jgi:predicted peptidase
LFLHGKGESGADGVRTLIHGPIRAANFAPQNWPFLIVVPQKPDAEKLWPDYSTELNKLLVAVDQHYSPSDTQRYLTGLSQGGNGTWMLIDQLAWLFAAAIPICGWSSRTDLGTAFADVPVWAFHGSADDAIPAHMSEEAVDQVVKAGGEAKLTIYDGVGHDSWTQTYNNAEVPQWLLRHRRNNS